MAVSHYMRFAIDDGSMVRKMFEEGIKLKAKWGQDKVFDFSLGNPDVAPPLALDKTLKKIVETNEQGSHGYMPNAGFPVVREKLAEFLSDIYAQNLSKKITQELVVLTVGAAGAMNVVLKSILDNEDEVVVLAPYFMEYKYYIKNHGGLLKVVETDRYFRLDPYRLADSVTEKTKAIIVNSPNNPTGVVYSKNELNVIGEILNDKSKKFGRPIVLISDEPYRKIVYGVKVPSVFESYDNSIVVSSFSKELSIPGERLGYICVNPLMDDKEILLSAAIMANRILGFVNAPALMQRALPALLGESVDVGVYQKRMDILVNGLEEIGYCFNRPEGTFYLFPKCPIDDDIEFIELLKDELILAVPGAGFGRSGFFRLSLCMDEEKIVRSIDGFKRALYKSWGL